MSNKAFLCLLGFGFFLLAGMIAPPLAMNACLAPSHTSPSRLVIAPNCDHFATRLF